MRARVVVIAGLAVAVAVGGEANAAGHKAKPKPKPVPPVCNIVTDGAGDSNVDLTLGLAPSKMPADANGDILSADLASDGKFVTAVMRVKSLATPDTAFPEAHLYMLSWTAPGHSSPVYLSAAVDPNPASAAYGPQFIFGDGASVTAPALGPIVNYYNVASAAVKGTVDTAKNTITLSVPVSAISSYGKYTPGSHFSSIEASTQALINGPVLPTNVPDVGGSIGWGFQEDTAAGSKDYVAGTPSCVKPGS
jgi:hypothetical protein